jgi:hypothetical protein
MRPDNLAARANRAMRDVSATLACSILPTGS